MAEPKAGELAELYQRHVGRAAALARLLTADDQAAEDLVHALRDDVLPPAVEATLGDRNWWLPRWLDRLLPHVDIEGEPAIPVPERAATDGTRADGDPEPVPVP